jgi:Asp-tRNA(Asn)/Glu-tRNA(Gln) amidotransferase C subunit
MLTPSEFDQLLKASCLDLPDHEKETFLSKLQNIIQFLDRIQNTSLDEQTQPLITPLEDQKSIPQTN